MDDVDFTAVIFLSLLRVGELLPWTLSTCSLRKKQRKTPPWVEADSTLYHIAVCEFV